MKTVTNLLRVPISCERLKIDKGTKEEIIIKTIKNIQNQRE
jgi:hypothetical protein